MFAVTFIAVGDWLGLLIFVIIAIIAGLKKNVGQSPEDRPVPPFPRPEIPQPPLRRPPVQTPPVNVPREPQRRRPLPPELQERYEEFLAEKERRRREMMRQDVPPLPPVAAEQFEEPVRRLVDVQHDVVNMPSQEPKAPHFARGIQVPPVPHPVAAPAVAPSLHAQQFRALLKNRDAVRRAIVAKELLGPPLALRADWGT